VGTRRGDRGLLADEALTLMSNDSSADLGVLSAADRTKQRNESATELVKALLIINGGGAVALLAYLQAIWIPSPVLARPTIIGIGCLAFGVLVAATFHLFRHQASLHYQFGTKEAGKKFDRLYLVSASVSLIAFLIGVSVVLIGALRALP
jgi:hypothetical protein